MEIGPDGSATFGRLPSVPVLFLSGHMPDTEPFPDPNSPEWTIAWTIKRALRLHLGPKHRYLPATIAREVVAALHLSKWRLVKEPPSPPHSTFGPKLDDK
jgi:hypothetical protein